MFCCSRSLPDTDFHCRCPVSLVSPLNRFVTLSSLPNLPLSSLIRLLSSLLPPPPSGTCSLNCVYSAQQLLFAIFGLRLLINLQGIFLPYLRCSHAVCCTCAPTKERFANDDKTEGRDERQPLQTGQSHPQHLPCARLLHSVTSHRTRSLIDQKLRQLSMCLLRRLLFLPAPHPTTQFFSIDPILSSSVPLPSVSF
jgi:hypothetical protein